MLSLAFVVILEWGVVSPKRGISPQLLIQWNILLYLPWFSAAVWLISCKVPRKDFGRPVWSLPHSTLPLVPLGLWCVWGPIQGAASVFSPEISPFNPQSVSHNLVKREPHVGGTGPSLCGGAAVGLSENPALPCHRHIMCQVVFQVKEVKLGTKDGFQLKL